MRITLVQTDVVHGDPGANLTFLEEGLPEDPGDLVVLPELATAGYVFDDRSQVEALAETLAQSSSVTRLTGIAKQFRTKIVMGLPERDGELLYNTVVVVGPEGLCGRYRKCFLSSLDQRYYARGGRIEIVEVAGFRVGLMICLDIWFPELAREYIRAGVDLFVHCGNFGAPESLAIARARAIEGNTPVVTCNRVGTEPYGGVDAFYRGQSQVIDDQGARIHRCGSQSEVVTVELDLLPRTPKRLFGVDLFGEIEAFRAIRGLDSFD